MTSPAAAQPLSEAIEALKSQGFSGQVVAADSERVLIDRTVGMAATPKQWIWGSVSKQVTAALIMSEVDRGTLDLDDTVRARLPTFRDPQGGKATVRQLLQHTSGLANPYAGVAEGQTPAFFLRRSKNVGGAADALGFCAGPPAAKPGSFSYNNCDTIVAGTILERASKRSFADLLAERLTRPLGMTSTRLARPGERLQTGQSQRSASRMNVAAYGAAGAMIGSATDLVRFNQALMNGKLMTRGSRETLWKGEPSLGYVALGAWSFAAPLRGCNGPVKLIERRGSVDGVQARNIIAPDLKRTLIAFTPKDDFDFGEIWQGKGASYELASAAFCDQQIR
jgi:CubicO group peptidase (beta-lactamase class C family)